MSAKILIIDDDVTLCQTLDQILHQAGYTTILAHTAEDGLHQIQKQSPDLVLLDVMIPIMGGWVACRRIRAFSNVPILFLTALGGVQSTVRGLEVGGDDYLVKPIDSAELLARIKAHLRRARKQVSPENRLVFGQGELTVDFSTQKVLVDGEEVELTPREFDLLAILINYAGRVLTPDVLAEKAWGMTDKAARNNIKPYVHYLRKKIERDPAMPRWIQTVRGVGYRFVEE
ncbi:MAG: DNA-binding response regulator [Chloroflexi bacterium]|nr:MAG: DNA-binding response regulator [Chloroflexota bacterium]